jgi:hypothetical protein
MPLNRPARQSLKAPTPCATLLLAASWSAPPLRAEMRPALSPDIAPVQTGTAARKIDLGLASDSIHDRTLPRIWSEDGELTAMRRVLADPAKRAHAIGHLAEEDFVTREPGWRKTRAANAPENDVWRRVGRELEGAQCKTHASGDPAEYMRDMFKDAKAEHFLVPDDHVGPLVQKIEQQLAKAQATGNERVAATWRGQLARVKPLGRTYGKLERAVTGAAGRTIGVTALKAAGGAALFAFAADGTVIVYRSANGELTPQQTAEAFAEARVKSAVVGTAVYGAVLLGANPAGITVVVVGGVFYLVADYVIDDLRPAYESSPMTTAQIDQVMPLGKQTMDTRISGRGDDVPMLFSGR